MYFKNAIVIRGIGLKGWSQESNNRRNKSTFLKPPVTVLHLLLATFNLLPKEIQTAKIQLVTDVRRPRHLELKITMKKSKIMKIYREITPLTPGDLYTLANYPNATFDYPLHNHPEYELYLIMQASGNRIIGDKMEKYQFNQ